jgi:hypothetical protein
MKSTEGTRPEQKDDGFGKGGVSGQPLGPHEGPVAGGADNTRGENVPSREGSGGGAKKGKSRAGSDYPQGSHANPSDTSRGADSSDKEFRNNQPNASTLKGNKSNEDEGLDIE